MIKRFLVLLLWLLLVFPVVAQQGLKYSEYPRVTKLNDRYLLLSADPGITNYAILWSDLKFQIMGLTFTNLTVTTNNTFLSFITNLFSTTEFVTNLTAVTEFVTNLTATTITNNTFLTTNVTIQFPGGATNLNLTPNSLMYSDINDEESSIPNAVGVLTNNGAGGIGFTARIQLEEVDAENFYPTNTFTLLTNSPFLMTDGNGKLIAGVELPGTNVLLSAGANITFTTNGSGGISISGNSTNTVDTSTNNLIVVTNVIVYSNLTVLQNIYVSTNFSTNFYSTTSYITNLFTSIAYITNLYSSSVFITNIYASTNFSTNLYFLSGKGNTLVISNNINLDYLTVSKLMATDAAKNVTNANVSARFTFTGNVLDIASGSIPNADLQNSSLTIAGTANQVSVSGGGPVSLGGTATLSLPSPVITPGNLSAPQITNTSFAASGVVTNDANGKLYTTPTIQNALLANSSITIQGSVVALGGSTLAAGSSPFFNAANITNLTVQYSTNVSPSSANLTFGQAYETNLTTDVTVLGFTMGNSFYETLVYSTTNGSASDHKTTMPAGVVGPPGSGTPPVFWTTNLHGADIYVSHFGNRRTNAWKIDWAP